MASTILSGFLLAIGWFLSRICINFAVGFINALLYNIWPWYKSLIDQYETRKDRQTSEK